MSTTFTNEDFRIEDGKLRLASRDPTGVLIMSKSVPAHVELLKVLRMVKVDRLDVGFLDITQGKNREVINMTRETNNPIAKLPCLYYFYDGKLRAKYKSGVSKAELEYWFQEKMRESATQNASSDRKSMTGGDMPGRFSMAQQLQGNPTSASNQGKKIDPKALGGMVGINVAWRSEHA